MSIEEMLFLSQLFNNKFKTTELTMLLKQLLEGLFMLIIRVYSNWNTPTILHSHLP